MKRRLLIIAVFLLLGAVVNVAVAWGFALWTFSASTIIAEAGLTATEAPAWSIQRRTRPGADAFLAIPFPHEHPAMWGMLLMQGLASDGLRAKVARTSTPPGSEHPLNYLYRRDATGWPCRALFCEREGYRSISPTSMSETYSSSEARGGIILRTNPRNEFPWQDRTLPLRPIWPGFAINTIFYATLLWLLIPGPFALRRLMRVRRGLCPRCAYPMGESAVCTECGIALPSST